MDYGKDIWKLISFLQDEGFEVELDSRDEKLGYRLRESVTKKIPYNLIIGDEEVKNKTISFRHYGSKDTETMKIDEFVYKVNFEIKEKSL